jgi:hydroxymethylpyrimidine pyrophosphatase-like HAD family hydrolase
MPRIHLVISDIDGCLGPESNAPMDAHKLARIADQNRLAQATPRPEHAPPLVTLCSGRPQPYAEAICRMIANTTVPVVAEMGVWLYDPAHNHFLIDPAITPAHLAAIDACTRWIRAELSPPPPSPRGVVIQPGKAASISLWHPDTRFLLSLKPQILDRIAREGWALRVSNTVAWINIELAHVSKGTGIDRLLALCPTPRQHLAGIGDTLGDLAIRERVGFFACPSNASPELKAHADYISPHPEIDGVLDILAHITTQDFLHKA